MASQIIRVDRDRVPQWALGTVEQDAYNMRYRFKSSSDLIDVRANASYSQTDSLMYNGLTGITPWYFDRRTEWYDGPSFDADPGYKDAYRNELRQKRFSADISNTSLLYTGRGLITLNYGLSYSDEDVAPGTNSSIKHDDLINNRFLRNAERQEYSAVFSAKWEPSEAWELMVGGRFNRVEVQDRNRLATATAETIIGQYRYTELLNCDPSVRRQHPWHRLEVEI